MAEIPEVQAYTDLSAATVAAGVGTTTLTGTTPGRMRTAMATQVATTLKDENGVVLAIYSVSGGWDVSQNGKIRLELESVGY